MPPSRGTRSGDAARRGQSAPGCGTLGLGTTGGAGECPQLGCSPPIRSKVGVGMLLAALPITRSLCLCPKWSLPPCAQGNGMGWIPGHSIGGTSQQPPIPVSPSPV